MVMIEQTGAAPGYPGAAHNTAANELPIPLHTLIAQGIASRTQFWRWERQGLHIIRVGGKLYVRMSDLNKFMDEQDAKARMVKEAA